MRPLQPGIKKVLQAAPKPLQRECHGDPRFPVLCTPGLSPNHDYGGSVAPGGAGSKGDIRGSAYGHFHSINKSFEHQVQGCLTQRLVELILLQDVPEVLHQMALLIQGMLLTQRAKRGLHKKPLRPSQN